MMKGRDNGIRNRYDGRGHKYLVNNFARFKISTLDIRAQRAILQVSPSVVCLVSYIGGRQLFICSGVIMECECISDDAFVASLITSASLLCSSNAVDEIANGLKIEVILVDGEVLEGHILGCDFHYNIAAIQVKTTTALSTAVARPIEEWPLDECAVQHTSPASRFPIYPGELVLALGRHFMDPFDIMAAPGEFSSVEIALPCDELRKSTCKITKNGIGGPIINRYGEVIGISFYTLSCTPFLPINIASKCFEHLKNGGYAPHPWLGVNVSALDEIPLSVLEKIKERFPSVSISRGVIIVEVARDSPAKASGLCAKDIITHCDDNSVGSRLELSEILWDKVGKHVELVVARASTCHQMRIIVGPIITNPIQYSWPVPEERYIVRSGQYWRRVPTW